MLSRVLVQIQQKRCYSVKLFLIHTKYRVNEVVNFANNIKYPTLNLKFPDRLKGTIVEKWADYWKTLSLDYYEVYTDSCKKAKENPRKMGLLLAAAGFVMCLGVLNPDEVSYRDTVLVQSNDLALIGSQVRNPEAVKYLSNLEKHFNDDTVRTQSFGIFTLVWFSEYNEKVGLFKAECDYLKPRYLSFYDRILDFGFMSRWWLMRRNMIDYDINPNEWSTNKK